MSCEQRVEVTAKPAETTVTSGKPVVKTWRADGTLYPLHPGAPNPDYSGQVAPDGWPQENSNIKPKVVY